MPVAGRPPKENAVNRMPKTHDWREFLNVPFADAPELPGEDELPEATLDWWVSISTMPHCAEWHSGDWQFAFDTARVHANFVRWGKDSPELRMRSRVMGTTTDARMAMRIRYVAPPSVPADEANGDKEPVRLDERRRRLGGEDED